MSKTQATESRPGSYQTTRETDRRSVHESLAAAAQDLDHRPDALTKRTNVQPLLQASPRVVAQGRLQALIDASPRQLLQRQQFGRLFGQKERAAPAVEPLASSQPTLQRLATLTWQTKVVDKFGPNATIFLNDALTQKNLMGYVPPDLMAGPKLHPVKLSTIMKAIFTSPRDYGTFDLNDEADLQRLAGIIVHTDRAAKGAGGGQPKVAVGRNEFQVVEKTQAEIFEILARWNAYYQYKMAQYAAMAKANSVFYNTLSQTDSFKNFENVGPMIGMVMSAISGMKPKKIHKNVRVAINTAARDTIAAILIYSGRPTGTEPFPGYVADLLANPKSIKPDRKVPDYKGHKAGITDSTVKGQGRAVLPEASAQRGAANSLLQHAVLESGPEGIQLWPYDDTTRRIYLAMDFGGARFQQQPDDHLLLKPNDMSQFGVHAQGSLKEAIADWRIRYG